MRLLPPWAPAIAFCFACHALWEGHGVVSPAFQNQDVAGIAYNARLLVTGALPYVDSAEIKPPGAFLLFAPLIALGGMRAVWAAAVLWGTAASLATGALASAVWGRHSGPRAALLHAACGAVASDGDINYSFWMALPFTLAAACACAAATATRLRRYTRLWGASGLLALFAVSIKPSAWPLAALFAALLVRELVRGDKERAMRAALAGSAGAFACAFLLALPYAAAGKLGALGEGLAAVSRFGDEYLAIVAEAAGGRLPAILQGAPCVWHQLPGPRLLALAGCVGFFPRSSVRPPLALGAWMFLLAACFGIAYTLRFFSPDNAQLWPALAVLAVRPAGLLARALDWTLRVRYLSLPATALLGLVAAKPGFGHRYGNVSFMAERDGIVADFCATYGPRLGPDDPVLGWGWSAWSVYEHCQRRAPGRNFKVMANVTTLNTNTCNSGHQPLLLRAGPEPTNFLAEVERRPPGLFVWSSYFEEMGGDPLETWLPLRGFLDRRYVVVAARPPFVALLRKDLVPPGTVPPAEYPRGVLFPAPPAAR